MGIMMGQRYTGRSCREHALIHTLAAIDFERIRSGLHLRAQVRGDVIAGGRRSNPVGKTSKSLIS